MLAKQLNLTPEQKMKLMPILADEAPKVEAIKANTSLTGLQKMEQLRALHEQTNPQVQAILSPQQYEQLQQIRQHEIEQTMQKKRAQQPQCRAWGAHRETMSRCLPIAVVLRTPAVFQLKGSYAQQTSSLLFSF